MIYDIPWGSNGSEYVLIIHQHSIVNELVTYTYRRACILEYDMGVVVITQDNSRVPT